MVSILKKEAVTEKSISSNATQFTLGIFQNDVTLIWTYFNNPLPLCHAPVLYVICVVSIVFSPVCAIELTTNWYQLHNGDYKGILEHSFGKQLPYKLSAITFGHL